MSPKVYEPTLIFATPVLTITAGGTSPLDFDFPTRTGAVITLIEYSLKIVTGATKQGDYGMAFDGTRAAPAADNDLPVSNGHFAVGAFEELFVTSGALALLTRDRWIPPEKFYIFQNPALQAFTSAGTVGVVARVYYKFVEFKAAEYGGSLARRR